jgi:hypothetical protein
MPNREAKKPPQDHQPPPTLDSILETLQRRVGEAAETMDPVDLAEACSYLVKIDEHRKQSRYMEQALQSLMPLLVQMMSGVGADSKPS